jgi:hypothetical protein
MVWCPELAGDVRFTIHFKGKYVSTDKQQGTQIYFIVASGKTKVGVSTDPFRRLDQLQASSPVKLTLALAFVGGYTIERRIHAHLAGKLSHGEWYNVALSGKQAHDVLASIGLSHPTITYDVDDVRAARQARRDRRHSGQQLPRSVDDARTRGYEFWIDADGVSQPLAASTTLD